MAPPSLSTPCQSITRPPPPPQTHMLRNHSKMKISEQYLKIGSEVLIVSA